MKYFVGIDGEDLEVRLEEREGTLYAMMNGREIAIDFRRVSGGASWSLIIEDRSFPISFDPRPDGLAVTVGSEAYLVHVEDERTRAVRSVSKGKGRDHQKVILSLMPGIVRDIRVAPGDEVEAGQPLIILEAMKMENEIRAALAGVVKTVHVSMETTVNKGDPLVTLE